MLNDLKTFLQVQKSIGINVVYVNNKVKELITSKNIPTSHSKTNNTVKLPLEKLDNTNLIKAQNSVNITNYTNSINNSFNYSVLNNINNLNDIKEVLNNFNSCLLKETAINTVFGVGEFNKKILIIGEAPGNEEDEKGEPFVGKSGTILIKSLEYVNISRNDCFITNRVFWRPPGNRTPSDLEIEQCFPFIKQIIKVLNPKLIILVGKTATTNLLPNEPITKLVGQFFNINIDNTAYVARAVYHPSYLLRVPSKKIFLWHDVLDIASFIKKINT